MSLNDHLGSMNVCSTGGSFPWKHDNKAASGSEEAESLDVNTKDKSWKRTKEEEWKEDEDQLRWKEVNT